MRYIVNEVELSCFQLIKSVLDELYNTLPSSNDEKDKVIRSRLETLRDEYKELVNGMVPNYNDLYTSFAYLYRYVTAHTNIIYTNYGCTGIRFAI